MVRRGKEKEDPSAAARAQQRNLQPDLAAHAAAILLARYVADRGPRHNELAPFVCGTMSAMGEVVTLEEATAVLDGLEAQAGDGGPSDGSGSMKRGSRSSKLGWISVVGGPVEAARAIVARLTIDGPSSARSLRRVAQDVNAGRVPQEEVIQSWDDLVFAQGKPDAVFRAAKGLVAYVEVRDGRFNGFVTRQSYEAASRNRSTRWERGSAPPLNLWRADADVGVFAAALSASLPSRFKAKTPWPTVAAVERMALERAMAIDGLRKFRAALNQRLGRRAHVETIIADADGVDVVLVARFFEEPTELSRVFAEAWRTECAALVNDDTE